MMDDSTTVFEATLEYPTRLWADGYQKATIAMDRRQPADDMPVRACSDGLEE